MKRGWLFLMALLAFLVSVPVASSETIQVISSVHSFATDHTGDLVFDYLDISNEGRDVIISNRKAIDGSWILISRPFFEFDIRNLNASSTVNSASLTLKYASAGSRTPVEAHGYLGDGVPSVNDAMVSNYLGLTGPGPTSDVLAPFTMDVTSFVQSAVASGAKYAGFMLRYPFDGNLSSTYMEVAQIATPLAYYWPSDWYPTLTISGDNISSSLISVFPTGLEFGKVQKGASAGPFVMQITNDGNADLFLSDISLSGATFYGGVSAFSLDLSGCSPYLSGATPIPPGARGTFEVTFSPASTGRFDANILIQSNDPHAPAAGVGVYVKGTSVEARYIVRDLGTLGGDRSYATGVNEAGQVVGWSAYDTSPWWEGKHHAFLWESGASPQMRDLGTLGGYQSAAMGINESGQVVGYSATGGMWPQRAFLWDSGVSPQMRDLGTLGGDGSWAFGINDTGMVAGYSYNSNWRERAFVWQSGTSPQMVDLGFFIGGDRAAAYGIDNSGRVAGWSETSMSWPYYKRAAMWDSRTSPAGMTSLGTLTGESSTGTGINGAGQVVGSSSYDWSPSWQAKSHAFLWQSGTSPQMVDLGTLGGTESGVSRINSAGLAVGASTTEAGARHAVLWEGRLINDLNDLIPLNTGWELVQASDINDGGAIVGYGVVNGQERAFLLEPVFDIDKDGMPDSWETMHFGSIDRDGTGDWDGDGLTDLQEFQQGTNSKDADTDEDGMLDGWEVTHVFNPLFNDGAQDADGDGYTNLAEYLGGTDPRNPNSVSGQQISVSPLLLDFGSVVSGTSSCPLAINVSNTGTSNLYITGVTLSGATPFSVSSGGCSAFWTGANPIHPGSGCSLAVTFTPVTARQYGVYLGVSSNDPGHQGGVTVFLSGRGVLSGFSFVNTWARTYGGSGYDVGRCGESTADGGYILAGSTGSYGEGNGDIWVIKISPENEIVWQKTYGGSGYDEAHSVQQTADGGYILAASVNYDLCLIKLDSSGNIQWQKIADLGNYPGSKYTIRQTNDLGYVVAGTYAQRFDNYDVWVFKLDSQGGLVWQKAFGGGSYEGAHDIHQTSDGGYLVVGYAERLVQMYSDFWVVKLSAAGEMVWQKAYGDGDSDQANASVLTSDGGLVVVGSYASGSQFWALKLDASGSVIWQNLCGSGIPHSVDEAADGGYVVAGNANSKGKVVKLNPSGSIDWQKTYGGDSYEGFRSVRKMPGGGYLLTGYTASFGSGGNDLLLIKTDLNGNVGCGLAAESASSSISTSCAVNNTPATTNGISNSISVASLSVQNTAVAASTICQGMVSVSLVPYSPDPTTDRTPTLAWHPVSGATGYRIQISGTTSFLTTIIDDYVSGVTSYTPSSYLPVDFLYWRVSSSLNYLDFSAYDQLLILPQAFPDQDQDGMLDDWEVQHGLNPSANDAALDPDGDGYTNLSEYLAGTDPQDSNSSPAGGTIHTIRLDNPESVSFNTSPVTDLGSMVYLLGGSVHGSGATLFMIDPVTGASTWYGAPSGTSNLGTPAVISGRSGETVFVLTHTFSGTNLRAIGGDTGVTYYMVNLPQWGPPYAPASLTLDPSGKTVYGVSGNTWSGVSIWSVSTQTGIPSANQCRLSNWLSGASEQVVPLISGNSLYALAQTTTGVTLFAFDKNRMNYPPTAWARVSAFPLVDSPLPAPPISGGSIFVVSAYGGVTAYNKNTLAFGGSDQFSLPWGSRVIASPVTNGEFLALASNREAAGEAWVHVFDLTRPLIQGPAWSYSWSGTSVVTTPVLCNGTLYVAVNVAGIGGRIDRFTLAGHSGQVVAPDYASITLDAMGKRLGYFDRDSIIIKGDRLIAVSNGGSGLAGAAPANTPYLYAFDVNAGGAMHWRQLKFDSQRTGESTLIDSDGDGLHDEEERALGANPFDADTDRDGMPDGWEAVYGLNPLLNDAAEDNDGDGYTNLQEFLAHTNPNDNASFPARKGDSDGSGAVDLADAILALRVVSGASPYGIRPNYPASGADVNGDNRIGIEEVIYIIQAISGLHGSGATGGSIWCSATGGSAWHGTTSGGLWDGYSGGGMSGSYLKGSFSGTLVTMPYWGVQGYAGMWQTTPCNIGLEGTWSGVFSPSDGLEGQSVLFSVDSTGWITAFTNGVDEYAGWLVCSGNGLSGTLAAQNGPKEVLLFQCIVSETGITGEYDSVRNEDGSTVHRDGTVTLTPP